MRIVTTDHYDNWIRKLRDRQGKFRIERYFERIQNGEPLFGDYKRIRPGIIEVRFDFAHGYRVYLTQEGNEVLLLLVGGDKSTQKRDIELAVRLAEEWRRERKNENVRV